MHPLRQRYWILPVVCAVGAMPLSTPAAAAPASSVVTCGQTITQNTTLTDDLLDCPGEGLLVGADNIRIDLGGHTINGAVVSGGHCFSGPLVGPCDGISLQEHSGLTITNGSITGFLTGIGGIGAQASSGDHINHLSISGDVTAIAVGGNNEITHNHVDNAITVTTQSDVSYNTGTPFDSGRGVAGIFTAGGDHDRIEHNTILRIDVHGTTDSYIAHNVITGAYIGLHGSADRDVVTSNLLLQSNLFSLGSSDTVLSHNVLLGPRPLLNGIRVGWDPNGPNVANDGVQVIGNLVVGYGLDGIYIDYNKTATHTHVGGNVVIANGHDGIENGDVSATLTGNITIANKALGIESVAGATDGGGNRAAANGNPVECTIITCH